MFVEQAGDLLDSPSLDDGQHIGLVPAVLQRDQNFVHGHATLQGIFARLQVVLDAPGTCQQPEQLRVLDQADCLETLPNGGRRVAALDAKLHVTAACRARIHLALSETEIDI